jgi:hypothetical protein
VDTEQIRREMIAKRAAIDHKLDLLSARTTEAKREAMQGSLALLLASAAVISSIWLVRQRRVRRARRLLRSSVRL